MVKLESIAELGVSEAKEMLATVCQSVVSFAFVPLAIFPSRVHHVDRSKHEG